MRDYKVNREKRNGNTPIPENLLEVLSEAQRQVLPGLKFAGWEPRFLRQQVFQGRTLVMYNSNDGSIGMLNEDGRFINQDNTKVREKEIEIKDPTSKDLRYF
jgi:hypothetical protein